MPANTSPKRSRLLVKSAVKHCDCMDPESHEDLDRRKCVLNWKFELIARRYIHLRNLTDLCSSPSPPTPVTLLVGKEKVAFQIHRETFGFFSEFFDALFFGRFVESNMTEIELPEDDPNIVEAFKDFVYGGMIEKRAVRHLAPEKLWLFGQKMGSPEFCNEAMGLLFSESYEIYRARTLEGARWILKNIEPDSRLGKFFSAYVSCWGRPEKSDRSLMYERSRHGPSEFEESWANFGGVVHEYKDNAMRRASTPYLCYHFAKYLEPTILLCPKIYRNRQALESRKDAYAPRSVWVWAGEESPVDLPHWGYLVPLEEDCREDPGDDARSINSWASTEDLEEEDF